MSKRISKASENGIAYMKYKREVKKFNYVTRYYMWRHQEFWQELLRKLKRPQWLYQHIEACDRIKVSNLRRFCENVLKDKYNYRTIKRVFDFLGPKRELLFLATQKYLLNNPTGDDVRPLKKVRDSYLRKVVEPIVESFKGLVMERAYHDSGSAPIEDKQIAGYLAILMAIHKFDFHSNNAISSLAMGQFTNELRWVNIEETEIVYMADSDRTERIKQIRKKSKETTDLQSDSTVRDSMNVLNSVKAYVPLDERITGTKDDTGPRIDFVVSSYATPEEYLLEQEVRYYFIKYLTEEEYEIAKRVFGLEGNPPMTIREIADELSVKEYVISDKLLKIKKKLRIPELKELLQEIIARRNRQISYAFA